jgi:hypothetical protein
MHEVFIFARGIATLVAARDVKCSVQCRKSTIQADTFFEAVFNVTNAPHKYDAEGSILGL